MDVSNSIAAPAAGQAFVFSPPGAPPGPVENPYRRIPLDVLSRRLAAYAALPEAVRQQFRRNHPESDKFFLLHPVADVPAMGGGR